MPFDINDLLLLISLNSFVTCLVLFVLYILFPEVPETREWFLGSFFLFISPLFLMSREIMPHWFSINIGHFFYFAAMAVFYVGMCTAIEKKPNYSQLIIVCSLATFAILIAPKTTEYTTVRIFINAAGIGVLALMSTVVLLRESTLHQKGRLFLGLQFAIIALTQILRALSAYWQDDYSSDYLTSKNTLEQLSMLVTVMAQTAYTAGFILVISENFRCRLNVKIEELSKAKEHAEALAITDPLTGCFNRYKIAEVFAEQLALNHRYGQQLSLIMLDIDHFKSINDNFGHPVGDEVLIKVSTLLQKEIRATDVCGRWGGEEFIIITPATDSEGAMTLAENLRSKINQASFHPLVKVSASFGVGELLKDETHHEFIKRVDACLYNAKQNGRNCVALCR